MFSNGSGNASKEEGRGERERERDGKTRAMYSQSSEFGVGLEEKLREKLEFVSVQTPAQKEKRENIIV